MRCVAWLLFSALCFVATNASANWQYTTWGMTKDQVIAASHGTAVDIAPDRKAGQRVSSSHMTALLQAPYTSGQYAFTAYFRFEDTTGRLVGVHLELQDAAVLASQLEGSLRSKYGKPDNVVNDDFVSALQWYRDSDQINFVRLSPTIMVNLDYSPRSTADNQGL